MGTFISHAAPLADGHRPEVRVEVGNGRITQIDTKRGNGKTVMVVLEDDNPKMREPINSWLRVSDPVYAAVEAAHRSGDLISYRIECSRRDGKDPHAPIDILRGVPAGPDGQPVPGGRADMAVAKDNVIKRFAAINGTPSEEALTHPAEDPDGDGNRVRPMTDADLAKLDQNNPASNAPAASALTADQALSGLAAARQNGAAPGVVDTLEALAFAVGADPAAITTAGVEAPSEPVRTSARGRVVAREEQPWKLYNSDGQVNTGSYAVQAVLSARSVATEQLTQALPPTDDEAAAAVPPRGHVRVLANELLALADDVQQRVTGDSRPDRCANSHTRARALVFEAIETVAPIPWGAQEQDRTAWADQVVDYAVSELATAVQDAGAYGESRATPPPAPEQPTAEQGTPEQVTPEQPTAAAGDHQGSTPAPAPTRQRLHPGDEGFIEPDDITRRRFADLAVSAGFDPTPGSPVTAFLTHHFGASKVKDVHSVDLQNVLAYYASKGPDAASTFNADVHAATAQHLPASGS